MPDDVEKFLSEKEAAMKAFDEKPEVST